MSLDNVHPRQKEISHWARSLLVFHAIFTIGGSLTLLAPVWFNVDGSQYYPIELFLVLFLYWSAMAGFWKVKYFPNESLTNWKKVRVEISYNTGEKPTPKNLLCHFSIK